jgi:hypothetical protein
MLIYIHVIRNTVLLAVLSTVGKGTRTNDDDDGDDNNNNVFRYSSSGL